MYLLRMNNVKKMRRAKGLTQAQLAELAGVEQATVSRLERNDVRITMRQIHMIADALGASLSELFANDRSEAESVLVEAFRSLPPDRQQGWLDLARTIHSKESPQTNQPPRNH